MWSDKNNRRCLLLTALLLVCSAVCFCAWGFLLQRGLFDAKGESLMRNLPAACGILFLMAAFCAEVWFLHNREQKVKQLAETIRSARLGQEQQELRSNDEGPWSVLCSELYKAMHRLWQQGLFYQENQAHLADAIADISHQLKTPLTSMLLMTELLQNEALSQQQRAVFLQQLKRQIDRLEWLVSSLLKLSRIDAGTAVFERHQIGITQLLCKAAEPLAAAMDIKNIRLEIRAEERQDKGKQDEETQADGQLQEMSLYCDPAWTAEALLNVIKNCVEYTPEGGAITASFSENPLYVEICITDTGPGIDKEDLPHIFQRFYRGKNAGKDSVGIGLSLAESIVRRQQGQLLAESQSGQGSRFLFRFYKTVV